MGGMYLIYSAYFLSTGFDTIYLIISIVIALTYAGLGYTFTKSNLQCQKKIAGHI